MTMSDPLADMLTRIRNGQTAGLAVVKSPFSSLRMRVLEVLKAQGYIRHYEATGDTPATKEISIELKYAEGQPVIREINRISKPGRRVYSKIRDLPKVYNGLGISILSTPQGVLSDHEARAQNVGGEVLCEVF